jgi:hypothetical protein
MSGDAGYYRTWFRKSDSCLLGTTTKLYLPQ